MLFYVVLWCCERHIYLKCPILLKMNVIQHLILKQRESLCTLIVKIYIKTLCKNKKDSETFSVNCVKKYVNIIIYINGKLSNRGSLKIYVCGRCMTLEAVSTVYWNNNWKININNQVILSVIISECTIAKTPNCCYGHNHINDSFKLFWQTLLFPWHESNYSMYTAAIIHLTLNEWGFQ